VPAPAAMTASKMRQRKCAGARGDDRLEDAAEEVDLGAARVLGRELDVVGVAPCALHRPHRLLDDLVRRHPQLALHVDRRGGDERVDAGGVRLLEGLSCAIDVLLEGARQPAHRRILHGAGHRLHGLEVAGAGDREARLDDVHAHPLERLGDADLLVPGHRRAGALLAVAQGGVENDQFVALAHVGSPPPGPSPPGQSWIWIGVALRVLALARACRVVCPSGQQSQQRKRTAGRRDARDGMRAEDGAAVGLADGG